MKKDLEYIDLDVDEIVFEETAEASGEYEGEEAYDKDESAYDEEEYEDEEEYDDEEEYEDEEEYDENEEYDDEEEYEEDDDEEYDEDEEDDEVEYDEDEYDEEEYDENGAYEDNAYEDTVSVRQKGRKAPNPKTAKKKTTKKKASRRPHANKKSKNEKVAAASGKHAKIKAFFRDFNTVDAIVAGTGVFVLLVAVVTMVVWGNSKTIAKQVTSMVDVGQQLSNLEIIGESSLLAIADAKVNFATTMAEPSTEAEASEETKGDREVTVNLTSVERDLKIKFTGKESKKLISGTEFEVELTGSDKKMQTLTDDDKDGIIYKTRMTPGKYSVKVLPKDGYVFPTEATKVTVKDKIVYQKIEIADEVKSESEVNVAKEDTEKDIVEESKLEDTVEFVESTKTIIGGGDGYQQVDKSKITDPGTTARAGFYERFTQVTEEPSTPPAPPTETAVTEVQLNQTSLSMSPGNTATLTATVVPEEATDKEVSWTSSADAIARVAGGTVTAVAAGNATITATAGGKSAACAVTVTEATVSVTGVTLDTPTKTLTIGESNTLQATIAPENATNKEVTWNSSADTVASVDGGKVTAKTAGSTTITATSKDGGYTAACVVTVTAKTVPVTGVSLDVTSKTLNINEGFTLKAAVAPADATNKEVKFTTGNPKVATVGDKDGVVKAVGVGDTTITVTTAEGGKTALCTLKVTKTMKVTLNQTGVDILQKNTVVLKPTATGFAGTPAFTWASSAPKIAAVDTGGKVTAVAAGKATITVTAKDTDGASVTATCTVNVKAGASDDKKSKLKDNEGNQLYVKDNGNYREAVFADYYTASAFYKKITVAYKYTGWQTIDNVTYYFDKGGNKVTGTQVIRGVQYTFDGNGALSMGNGALGIDVSKWNGTINWSAVKNSGISYVIIRCGYRGSSTGALIQDPKFQANIKGAQAAGLKVGIYFFTQAVNEVEAVEEASMVLNLIKGYNIAYPVFIDTEGSGGRADGIDAGTRTAVCNAFCATIQNGGYKAGIYASKSWFEKKLNTGSLNQYKIWLAQYATKPTYGGRYDLWQYTSKGAVGGINGSVDLNISYLGY